MTTPGLARLMDLRRKMHAVIAGTQQLTGVQLATLADTPAMSAGLLYFKDDVLNVIRSISGVVIQLGEEVQAPIVNKSGDWIYNGTPVAILGAQGQRLAVTTANSSDPTTEAVIGLATHDIEDNQNGIATVFGKVRDLPLPIGSWTVGDKVFVNGGSLTKVPPLDAGHYLAFMGWVTQAHPTQGVIDVNPYVQPVIADVTANRPTIYRVGDTWFDTTLGKPIWWTGTEWVDATGATVV